MSSRLPQLPRSASSPTGNYIMSQIILAFSLVLILMIYRRTDVWMTSLTCLVFLSYTKQVDSMLPCVCSVIIDHRRHNVVRSLANNRQSSPHVYLMTHIFPRSDILSLIGTGYTLLGFPGSELKIEILNS